MYMIVRNWRALPPADEYNYFTVVVNTMRLSCDCYRYVGTSTTNSSVVCRQEMHEVRRCDLLVPTLAVGCKSTVTAAFPLVLHSVMQVHFFIYNYKVYQLLN